MTGIVLVPTRVAVLVLVITNKTIVHLIRSYACLVVGYVVKVKITVEGFLSEKIYSKTTGRKTDGGKRPPFCV